MQQSLVLDTPARTEDFGKLVTWTTSSGAMELIFLGYEDNSKVTSLCIDRRGVHYKTRSAHIKSTGKRISERAIEKILAAESDRCEREANKRERTEDVACA